MEKLLEFDEHAAAEQQEQDEAAEAIAQDPTILATKGMRDPEARQRTKQPGVRREPTYNEARTVECIESLLHSGKIPTPSIVSEVQRAADKHQRLNPVDLMTVERLQAIAAGESLNVAGESRFLGRQQQKKRDQQAQPVISRNEFMQLYSEEAGVHEAESQPGDSGGKAEAEERKEAAAPAEEHKDAEPPASPPMQREPRKPLKQLLFEQMTAQGRRRPADLSDHILEEKMQEHHHREYKEDNIVPSKEE